MSTTPGRKDWWQAEDGKWYPPDRGPDGFKASAVGAPAPSRPVFLEDGGRGLVRQGFWLGVGIALAFMVIGAVLWMLAAILLALAVA